MLSESNFAHLGNLFIIAAPSGAGKTSLVKALIENNNQLKVSVSHTTRAPRSGEEDGKNYHFVSSEQFEEALGQGTFLEHAEVFGHYYGTSKIWVNDQLALGNDVILEIDWQGARKVRELMPCISIFILPPSKQALETRLKTRKQDPSRVIEDRMAKASLEISHFNEFDFTVVNDRFELAYEQLQAIIRAHRCTTKIQTVRFDGLISELIRES